LLAAELRRGGFIHKRADYYTLGGGAELGHGLSPEGDAILRKAAQGSGVELLMADDLQEMITRKSELMQRFEPRVLINIGGSQANLGDDGEVLHLQPGLVHGNGAGQGGNGLIGIALENHIPVIHMLNLKSVSAMAGIPYDGPPRKAIASGKIPWWSGIGLALFFVVLLTHKRWRLEPGEA
jgi:poly-gamma-glutamate system protein